MPSSTRGSIPTVGSDQAGAIRIVKVERVEDRTVCLCDRNGLLDDLGLGEPIIEPIESAILGIGREPGQGEILVFGPGALADRLGSLEERLRGGAPCARIQAGDVVGVQARQPEQQNDDADERNPKEASLGHGIFP